MCPHGTLRPHARPPCAMQVFMVSSDDRLDERTMQAILLSGHSRIPVFREGNRCVCVGGGTVGNMGGEGLMQVGMMLVGMVQRCGE